MITRRTLTSTFALVAAAPAEMIGSAQAQGTNVDQQAAFPSKITVRFGTNRKYVGKDEYYSSEFRDTSDGKQYEPGKINVSKAGSDWTADGSSLVRYPLTEAEATVETATAGSNQSDEISEFLDEVRAKQLTGGKTPANAGLVFIHGYAYKFLETFNTVGQIAEGYHNPSILCFCWPSCGDHLKYREDQAQAYGSGVAVALFLAKLLSRIAAMAPTDRPLLHFVSHSMGNRVLSAAIRVLSATKPPLVKNFYFEHALLMAADEDYHAFDRSDLLKPMLAMVSKSINVYTNRNDAAMVLSKILNGVPPLGSDGPARFPIDSKLYWISCDDVADREDRNGKETWGHQYFRLSLRVMADVRAVFDNVAPAKIPHRVSAGPEWQGQKFKITPT